jgi:hypothetical protein
MSTFRDGVKRIMPPWLLDVVGEGISYAVGLVLDAMAESVRMGVKAGAPDGALTDSFSLIGDEVGIDRGPNELEPDYAARLKTSRQSYKTSGSSHRLLQQMRHFFSPSFIPMSVVSDRGVWHVIDPTTGIVTKTIVSPTNWQWDSHAYGIATAGTQRWRRIWVIIDLPPWSKRQWGSGFRWGTGTWGTTATREEVSAVRRLAEKWRSAGTHITNVIVLFTPGLFNVAHAPGWPMPSGNFDDPAVRLARNAAFWEGLPHS